VRSGERGAIQVRSIFLCNCPLLVRRRLWFPVHREPGRAADLGAAAAPRPNPEIAESAEEVAESEGPGAVQLQWKNWCTIW